MYCFGICYVVIHICIDVVSKRNKAEGRRRSLNNHRLNTSTKQLYLFMFVLDAIFFFILVSADFWDTAGQEAFNRMHPSYYYRSHCCILVFDVTRKITYQHLSDWYKELREHCPNIPCVLVANKIDVDYNVRCIFL